MLPSDVWVAKAVHDTALLADTTVLKPAIGAAQQAMDTAALDKFTAAAYRHFPTNVSYIRARAGAFCSAAAASPWSRSWTMGAASASRDE